MTGKKIKAKKMGIFVSTLRHNSDKKTVTENKIQNNVRQYKIGEFLCDITKYDFWICGVLHFFPIKYPSGGKFTTRPRAKKYIANIIAGMGDYQNLVKII